jgi:hypothetical protein
LFLQAPAKHPFSGFVLHQNFIGFIFALRTDMFSDPERRVLKVKEAFDEFQRCAQNLPQLW